MQNYHSLLVWQKAHKVAIEIRELTDSWPRRDNAGLVESARFSALQPRIEELRRMLYGLIKKARGDSRQ